MLALALNTGPQDVSVLLQQLNTLIGLLNAQVPGLFARSGTLTGNGADTTDDVIFSAVLPISFFNFAGALRLHTAGVTAANANTKSVKHKINDTATTVTLVGLSAVAANAVKWKMDTYIVRTGASAQSYDFQYQDGTNATTGSGTATEVETNAITISCTGTSVAAGAANDVQLQTATLEVVR